MGSVCGKTSRVGRPLGDSLQESSEGLDKSGVEQGHGNPGQTRLGLLERLVRCVSLQLCTTPEDTAVVKRWVFVAMSRGSKPHSVLLFLIELLHTGR